MPALETSPDDEHFLRLAIAEAHAAQAAGEVPVGAIIVSSTGEVIAAGNNRVLRDNDPTAHAEIVALRAAGLALANYRLLTPSGEGCTLYCTLEPCAMCAGAILHARIARLVYAAPDPKAGACGSVLTVLNHPALNHRVEVLPGVLADDCSTLLTSFFRARRSSKRHSTPSLHHTLLTETDSMPTSKSAAKKSAKKSTTPPSKRWSAKVTTDSTHPTPGIFNESAEAIANDLAKPSVSPKGPGQGMQMLSFYKNRAGKNLSTERKKTLESAKEILRAKEGKALAKKAPAKKSAAKKSPAKKVSAKKKAS